MRILFVATADSIHTARWVNQLLGEGWDIHLFPVEDTDAHPALRGVTVHDMKTVHDGDVDPSVRLLDRFWRIFKRCWPLRRGRYRAERLLMRLLPHCSERARRLARTIALLSPDMVHSMGLQHSGYLTLEARDLLRKPFPMWAVSIWGSDVYLFGRLQDHIEGIRNVLSLCDYYACESQRDLALGRTFGFKGEMFPVVPMAGGFEIERMTRLRQSGPTSSRRVILLKGYQGWAGRALVGLRAIELCAGLLRGYSIAVYCAWGEDVRIAAELLQHTTGIPIEIVPRVPHDDMLRLHGRARISIGLSISDGTPSSLLEAMVMGSFPIQSNTSTADEWISDGETGILVHPEEPQEVAAAIRRAVTDDDLVNRAAEINARVAAERLDVSVIRPRVIEMYQKVALRACEKQARAGQR